MEETVKSLILAVALVLLPSLCVAQGVQPQSRFVFHSTADINQHWFATNWTIGNVKDRAPNNINVFPGIGYRTDTMWFESMFQRQWSPVGNSWALDFRYSAEIGRTVIYVESSPLLSRKGEYEFIFVNVRTWKRLSIGAETENIHVAGPDVIDVGPRLSFPVASIKGYGLSVSAAYQFHYRAADIPRLYVAVNRRLKR